MDNSLQSQGLMSDSCTSIGTSVPEHQVKMTVEFHYFIDREMDPKKRSAKVIAEERARAKGMPPSQTSVSELPRFYATYSIGNTYDGKTEILHPTSSFWSSYHDVDVSLEFLADLYEEPIEFKIWRISKVWSDPPDAPRKEATSRSHTPHPPQSGAPVSTGSSSTSASQHASSVHSTHATPTPSISRSTTPAPPTQTLAPVVRPARAPQQTIVVPRASLHAMSKRIASLSKEVGLTPKERHKLETYRTYIMTNYKQLPPTVKVRAGIDPSPRRMADQAKIPAAPHISGISDLRKDSTPGNALQPSHGHQHPATASPSRTTSAKRSQPHGHADTHVKDSPTKGQGHSASGKGEPAPVLAPTPGPPAVNVMPPEALAAVAAQAVSSVKDTGAAPKPAAPTPAPVKEPSRPSSPTPSRPKSPLTRPTSPSTAANRAVRAAPIMPIKSVVTDISGVCRFVRPKTPQQPHHHNEPDVTVGLVPELAKKKRMLVDHHVHVASIFVDPSLLFLGELHVQEPLRCKVEGLQEAEVGISINTSLLTPEQEETLNPMCITVVHAENLPDKPMTFAQLQHSCNPVYTRFAFLDQPSSRHKSRTVQPQARFVRFDSKHVILTGLHDSEKLRDFFLHNALEIEVHDRDKRTLERDRTQGPDATDLQGVQPHGLAQFSLAELTAGVTLLTLRAPIVPARSNNERHMKNSVPPGLYLESDAALKIRVRCKYPVFNLHDNTFSLFTRAVVVFKRLDLNLLQWLCNYVQTCNIAALGLDRMDDNRLEPAMLLERYKLSPDQRLDTALDIITGCLVTDSNCGVLFLEGLCDGAMARLLADLAAAIDFVTEEYQVYADSTFTVTERLWMHVAPNLSWIHVRPRCSDIMNDPRTFIRARVSKEAFHGVRIMNELMTFPLDTIFDVVQHRLLPTLEMLRQMDQCFGQHHSLQFIPVARVADALGLTGDTPPSTAEDVDSRQLIRSPSPRRRIDSRNGHFSQSILSRKLRAPLDFVQMYKDRYPHSGLPELREPIGTSNVFPYSPQTLNTAVQRQSQLAKAILDADDRHLYRYAFDRDRTLQLVDEHELARQAEDDARQRWTSPSNFLVGKAVGWQTIDCSRLEVPYREGTIFEVTDMRLPNTRLGSPVTASPNALALPSLSRESRQGWSPADRSIKVQQSAV
ncbi:hypothetical protein RI367_006580 [Sorochytrium milnesiophthora]